MGFFWYSLAKLKLFLLGPEDKITAGEPSYYIGI